MERRLPATIPPPKRHRSRSGRYHLSDPYFRFYFRFLAPNQDELTYHPELVLPRIRDGLRAFVGVTAFEELSRQWVTEQGRTGKLPLAVQEVGSHWSRAVQVDVVGINWAERAILLGECKWGTGSIDRAVIREMLESKTPKVLKDLPEEGAGWKVHRAFFARTGFTEAARAEARSAGALLVDLATLDADLRETLVGTEASME